jgi:hypothetical protein
MYTQPHTTHTQPTAPPGATLFSHHEKTAVMFVLHPDGESSPGGSSDSPFRANIKFWGKQFLFWAAIRTAYVFFGERGAQKKITQ